MKTTGFIKRIFGKKEEKDRPAKGSELTLRIIEVHIVEIQEILRGMDTKLGKMVKGLDSLSRYFEFELERAKKIAEFEDKAPGKDDDMF